MKILECATCGCSFGLTELYEKNRREDHVGFYCPNGHSNVFRGESDADKYKRLMEQAQSRVNSLQVQVESVQRSKDRVERTLKTMKKRAAVGVCPCCNRTVSQLARHMQSKHKEFLALNGVGTQKQLPETVGSVQ